jgi:hypothetical protein
MRTLLVALALALAALAALPSASASAVPDPACVPPDPFQSGVCAGTWGTSYLCVVARIGPPEHGACVDPAQPDAIVCVFDACVGVRALTGGVVACVPPQAQDGVCAGDVQEGLCAWYWVLRTDFTSVCVAPGPAVVACSNHLWDDDPNALYECKGVL